jgi:hypothetical protein
LLWNIPKHRDHRKQFQFPHVCTWRT